MLNPSFSGLSDVPALLEIFQNNLNKHLLNILYISCYTQDLGGVLSVVVLFGGFAISNNGDGTVGIKGVYLAFGSETFPEPPD